MTKIPSRLIKDYGIIGLAYIAILLVLRPVFLGEYNLTASLLVVTVVHTPLLLLVFFIGEMGVTYVLRKPFSYSDTLETRFKHFVLCGAICIPVMMVLLTQANAILIHGLGHAERAWLDQNGLLTLKWLMPCCSSCVVAALIMTVAMTALSEVRQMRYVLEDLKAINKMLEESQENSLSPPYQDTLHEEVTLQGNSRTPLRLAPHDILYIESTANYLNIVYFNDSELCQTRFRSPLKDVESALADYPFLVHIHRAFLVNINFITQVTGNAAGYKVELLGSDKVLPVSKSNIAAFKEKLYAAEQPHTRPEASSSRLRGKIE